MKYTDVLIIGGGLSAISAALKLVDHAQVTIVMKGQRTEGNSWRAQGGIAAAIEATDSPELHEKDTLTAGCDQNDRHLVKILVEEGPARLKKWMDQGLLFDQSLSGDVMLGKEAAHGKRRILHAGGDQTGKVMMEFITKKLKDRAVILEDYCTIDFIVEQGRCVGAHFLDNDGQLQKITANRTILATGGIGGLFHETSNDDGLKGDGLAIAYRAGAVLQDLEYIQFHPTLMVSQNKVIGLASEAIRGEGATLIDDEGNRLMEGVHPEQELAPRDVVARALYRQVQQGKNVYLDISSIANFSKRFPQITSLCEAGGIDWTKGKIPVRPGAHFHMGGVQADEYGQTTLPGLYAVGEVAGNAVHGANRLASNSLLEAIVFGERAGEHIRRDNYSVGWKRENTDDALVHQLAAPKLPTSLEISAYVTSNLGVVRNQQSIKNMLAWFKSYQLETISFRSRISWNKEEIERSNMLITAFLIAKSTLKRKNSCGAHYLDDELPKRSVQETRHTIIERIGSNPHCGLLEKRNCDEQTYAKTTVV